MTQSEGPGRRLPGPSEDTRPGGRRSAVMVHSRKLIPCVGGCGALVRKQNKSGLCGRCWNVYRAATPPEHGTHNRYDHWRCRCDLCRAANAAHNASARRKRYQAVEAGTVVISEHGRYAYANWGCRCETCTKAHTEASAPGQARYVQNHPDRIRTAGRRQYHKHQAETLDRAARRYQPWTGPELELAARTDLTAKQIALMIGRTKAGVQRMRRRLHEEPKVIQLAGLSAPRPGRSQRAGGG